MGPFGAHTYGMRSWPPALAIALLVVAACNSTRVVSISPVSLQQVWMITATAGWATAYDATYDSQHTLILHTVDGGSRWRNVSPPGGWRSAGLPDYLDANHAWLLTLTAPGEISVLRTSDSGSHWQTFTVRDSNVKEIGSVGLGNTNFLDPNNGWLWLSYGFEGDEQGSLYRTSDGGVTWTILSTTDPNKGVGNAVPWHGAKTGFTFVDQANGWLTATTYLPLPLLYQTHDGGATWARATYPPPPDHAALPNQGVTQPRFFSMTDGEFEVEAAPSYLYRTRDAGRTWSLAIAPGCCDDFVLDMEHAWSLSYDTQDTQGLYRTTDGGAHWTYIASNLNAQSAYEAQQHFHTTISGVEFVTPLVGYAIRSSGPVVPLVAGYGRPSPSIPTGTTGLLKTADGGATWTEVRYEIKL